MRKKIVTFLCVGVMALSLAGCDDKKEDKREKETTEVGSDELNVSFPGADDEDDKTEATTEEPDDTEEEIIADSDWVTGGCDRTGYVDVPAGWKEYESTNGEAYCLQYYTDEQDGIISLVDNDYGFDAEENNVADPALVVSEHYIEQHEELGATNISTEEVSMAGTTFYKSVDCVPEGTLTDYDYYMYNYVAYDSESDRFYTVTLEGKEDVIEGLDERIEETFSFDGSGAGTNAVDDDDSDDIDEDDDNAGSANVAGSSDWASYQVIVDGESYTLPCDFSKFEANGWSIAEAYEEDTIPGDDYIYVNIERNGQEADIIISNKGSNDIKAAEGEVVGVSIDFNLEGTKSCIAGNIGLGSSYKDVISAFGTPDDEYDVDDESKVLTYTSADSEDDYFSGLEIWITNGEVSEIEIKHW